MTDAERLRRLDDATKVLAAFSGASELVALRRDLYWRCDGEWAPITFFLAYTHPQAKGYSDSIGLRVEHLPALRQALADVYSVFDGTERFRHAWAACDLFAARVNGERPEKHRYPDNPALRPLFDAIEERGEE